MTFYYLIKILQARTQNNFKLLQQQEYYIVNISPTDSDFTIKQFQSCIWHYFFLQYDNIINNICLLKLSSRLSRAACKSVQEWLIPAKPLLIVRYLGTTPDSSSLAPLLTSICQQLSYTFMLPFEDIPDDLVPMSNLFGKLLSVLKLVLWN